MSVKSIDEIREETDALLRRCSRLRNEEQRREHIALCKQQLLNAGWRARDANLMTQGAIWILQLA